MTALDPELRAYLDDMRRGVVEELRAAIRAGDEELRAAIRAGDEELLTAMRAGDEKLRAAMRAGDEETRKTLSARLDELAAEVDGVDRGLRALIESDVVPKIEQVAEGVAAAREQARRDLHEELGAFGPRTVVGEATFAEVLRRIEHLEQHGV